MVDRESIRRAYDDLGPVYARERTADERSMEILADFLASVPAPARVLDAGCGPGAPVLANLDGDHDAVGLDVSRIQLGLAKNHAPGATPVQGDMAALPFAANAFDAVVAFWSLIHVPMAEHQTVIDEFARVLTADGRLLLCEGSNAWSGENPDWLDSGVAMAWDIAGPTATRGQLHDAGFTVEAEWGAPENLDGSDGDADVGNHPWTFFAARLVP